MGWFTIIKIQLFRSNELFQLFQKIHIRPQDCIEGFSGGDIEYPLGRVHFEPKYGDPYTYKPHLKSNIPRPGDGKC